MVLRGQSIANTKFRMGAFVVLAMRSTARFATPRNTDTNAPRAAGSSSMGTSCARWRAGQRASTCGTRRRTVDRVDEDERTLTEYRATLGRIVDTRGAWTGWFVSWCCGA